MPVGTQLAAGAEKASTVGAGEPGRAVDVAHVPRQHWRGPELGVAFLALVPGRRETMNWKKETKEWVEELRIVKGKKELRKGRKTKEDKDREVGL